MNNGDNKKRAECHVECGWFTGDRVSCSSGGSSLPWERELFCKHTNAATTAADANLNIYEPLRLLPTSRKLLLFFIFFLWNQSLQWNSSGDKAGRFPFPLFQVTMCFFRLIFDLFIVLMSLLRGCSCLCGTFPTKGVNEVPWTVRYHFRNWLRL